MISDLRMPVINGYEFIKKVRDIKPLVKVFLMTAFKIDDIEFRKELPFVIGRRNHSKTDSIRGFHQSGKQAYQ